MSLSRCGTINFVNSQSAARVRFLAIEAFDVADGRVVAVDSVLPVVAELDSAGSLTSIWTWTLDPSRRGRPTAKDVLLTTTDIVVASPAAGGLVRIDRETGSTTVVPLDEDIGWLVRDGENVWAVADPGREGAYEAFLQSPDRRRVVWEEPTVEDMERHRNRISGWFGRAPGSNEEWVPLVDPSDPTPTAADWQDTDDHETDHIGPPTPVWLVEGERVTRVELGGELAALAAIDGRVVAVCQLPSDPLIKAVQPGGSLSYIRPGTVLLGNDRPLRPVGTVAETSGGIAVDGSEAWLLGFNRHDDVFEVRRLDLESGAISEPIPSDGNVVAVVRGRMVALGWDRAEPDLTEDEYERPKRLVRITAVGGQASDVRLPSIDDAVVVDGSTVWFRAVEEQALIAVDVESATARKVAVHIDCTEFIPSVSVPEGIDPSAFESLELENLRGAFLGGWRSESREQYPFIRGVTFDAVELHGSFPHTAVVAVLRSTERPGVQFGRRWRLYDDLGNPQPLEYADIHLMEDIEAAGHGLPPLEDCVADDDGIVWF